MRGSQRSLIHFIPLFSSRPLIHSTLKKKQNELDTKRSKMIVILPKDTGTSPTPLWPTPQVKVSKYMYQKILSIDELPCLFIWFWLWNVWNLLDPLLIFRHCRQRCCWGYKLLLCAPQRTWGFGESFLLIHE